MTETAMVNTSAVADFWRWIEARRRDLDGLRDPSQPFWGEMLDRLQQVDERLWFRVSTHSAPERELIVTAEGQAEAFPAAEALVEAAPEIPGWRFIALIPGMGFDFRITFEGHLFDPGAMWFLPLSSEESPLLGLRVGVPDAQDVPSDQVFAAVVNILDTALGERMITSWIGHLEIGELPDDPEEEGWLELRELPAYIELHQQQGDRSRDPR